MSELTSTASEASLIIHHSHHTSFGVLTNSSIPMQCMLCPSSASYAMYIKHVLPFHCSLSLSLSLSLSHIPYIPRHEQRSKCHQTLDSNSSIIKIYIAHLNAHNENSDSLILATMKCFPWGPGSSLVIRLFQRSQLTRRAPSHTQDVFPE